MKKEKGVTLIALAVTIIVMLVLAGVTVVTLNGKTSITKNAEKARRETEIGRVVEKINIKVSENKVKDDLEDQVEMLIDDGYILEDGTIDVNTVLDGQVSNYGTGTDNNIFIIEGNKVIYIDEKGERVTQKEVNIDINESSFTFSRGSKSFITRWNVSAGDTFELPIATGHTNDNNFIVDWGDGTATETINDRNTALTARPQHTYAQAGEFDITITGHFNYFKLTMGNFATAKADQIKKLIKIISWGEVDAYEYGFENATNLTEIAIPTKNTFVNYNNDTGFYYMFSGCTSLRRIPNKLFQYAENAKGFEETFAYCYGLKQIPDNLFDNSTKATNFTKTFIGCSNITNGPKIWERTNANQITGMQQTYRDCEKINKTGLSSSIINKFF